MFEEPSETRTPVSAVATCVTASACSATGWSLRCSSGATPSAAVLHRLARQLRDDPLTHRAQERRGDPEDLGQLGAVAAVLRQRRGTRRAPGGDGARVVAVRGDVDGVHGTAAGGGTRVPGGEQGVGGGEARVELAQQCLATGLPMQPLSVPALREPYGAPG